MILTFEELSALTAERVETRYTHPAKQAWAQVVRDMRTHILGEYPAHLINARRPNEADEVHEFRKAVFEPITKSSFLAAEDALHRVFIDSASSIRTQRHVEEYLDSNSFDGRAFIEYVREVLFRWMLLDPNAAAVVLRDDEGLPRVSIIPSSVIVDITPYYIIWVVKDSGDEHVYRAVSDTAVIELTTRLVMGRSTYSAELIQTHDSPTPHRPWVVLGGQVAERGGGWYYESFLGAAVPFANDCLKQYSDWYASLVTASYAIREVRPVECDAPGCSGGWIYGEDDSTPRQRCKRCHGTGYVPSFSPYGVYIQGKDDPLTGQPAKPPVIFHTPPIEPLQYGERSWQEMYRQMRHALHLQYVDEAQSGLAKKIDREPAYAQLLKVRDHVYDHIIYTLVDSIARQLDPILYSPPAIYKPTQFDIRNQEELMNEIGQLKNAKAPRALVLELTRELIRNRYSGDVLMVRKHEFLMATDPLYEADAQHLAFLFSSGAVSRSDVLYHIHAPGVLDILIREALAIDPDLAYAMFNDFVALSQRVRERIAQQPDTLSINIPSLE